MTRFDEIKKKIQTKSSEQRETTRREYKQFFEHPLLYVALIASGLLSALAGLAIGLGVRVVDGKLSAYSDVGHIFFSMLYFVLFPYFFEFGLANWLHKFLHREPDNKTQFWTAAVMISITFIGTAITAYAAMDVLVTAGGFFTSFTEIPAGVQRWIAFALPTMFMLNIASGELYRQFTTEAILTRDATNELKQDQIAADMEIKLAQMKAKKDIAVHSANEYARHADEQAPVIGVARGRATWNAEHNNPDESLANKLFSPKQATADQIETLAAQQVDALQAKLNSPKA
jgi:hypothetical protein